MGPPPWLHWIERRLPSANLVVLRGRRCVLIDTGCSSDVDDTLGHLRTAGIEPADIDLVVNSHHHSDHVGGNRFFQSQFGLPIAASAIEADAINRRDPDACDAVYLDQPIEPYWVDELLHHDDTIDLGDRALRVLHLPGHSPGNLAFYDPMDEVLVAGDVVHATDVAWVDVARGGRQALETARASVERLCTLPVRWACSGHGPPMDEPAKAFDAAIRRYDQWLGDVKRAAWHGCKRILAFRLMLLPGLPRAQAAEYLLDCPWFAAYSQEVFGVAPQEFVAPLLEEMVRSKAAYWENDRLYATTPFRKPADGWMRGIPWPADWPAGGRTSA